MYDDLCGRRRAPRLQFVSGSRFLASLWIVCQHFLPHSERGVLVKSLWRSSCAVDYFIILSGFVTHWASRGSFATCARDGQRWLLTAKRWYGRRFGRVLSTTYVAMGASALMLRAVGGDVGVGHVARCFLLVEPWVAPSRWCPDGQTWTVAALAPCWLLYPVRAGVPSPLRKAVARWILTPCERSLHPSDHLRHHLANPTRGFAR